MPIFESSNLESVIVHRVGNKQTQEGLILSDATNKLNEQLQDLLTKYFISPFKAEEYYTFYHDDNLELNDIYALCAQIFENPDTLADASKEIAQKLYDACLHPNIKGGDLWVAYFNECQINGTTTNAIGIFKSENKDYFLKVSHNEEIWSKQEGDMSAKALFNIETQQGININKLDKGALIFNTESEKGYIVSVVDTTNRGQDAAYWKDEFLQLKIREDEYYNTRSELSAYKKFVTEHLPEEFENVEKADTAELLNRSVDYFKHNNQFDVQEFAEEVIKQPEVIESFKQFREDYQKENEIVLQDQFDINDEAVKKQARNFKSVIKLDKNFHIYVHGNSNLIEKGSDEKGTFYKVYYTEEA